MSISDSKLATQRHNLAIGEIDAVGENPQNEIVEGARKLWALTPHSLERSAGQREQSDRPIG